MKTNSTKAKLHEEIATLRSSLRQSRSLSLFDNKYFRQLGNDADDARTLRSSRSELRCRPVLVIAIVVVTPRWLRRGVFLRVPWPLLLRPGFLSGDPRNLVDASRLGLEAALGPLGPWLRRAIENSAREAGVKVLGGRVPSERQPPTLSSARSKRCPVDVNQVLVFLGQVAEDGTADRSQVPTKYIVSKNPGSRRGRLSYRNTCCRYLFSPWI